MVRRVSATAWGIAACGALCLAAAPALAAGGCLSQREAIAAVQSGRAVPLAKIRDDAQDAAGGEMIDADLCPRDGRLAYVITVLKPEGKVVTAVVDASSGRLINVK